MPIDFDVRIVFNDHSIQISYKVTPLDLLAQVAGTLGDNQRLYFVCCFTLFFFQKPLSIVDLIVIL